MYYYYSYSGTISPIYFYLFFLIFIIVIAGVWKTFQKAGKPGWAVLIPFYNIYVLTEISGKPIWLAFVIMFAGIIPLIGPIAVFVTQIIVSMGVAEKFGKSPVFGFLLLGLFGFIGYPILGFGDAKYHIHNHSLNDEILDEI